MQRNTALEREVVRVCRQARTAARDLAIAGEHERNAVLHAIADELLAQKGTLRSANKKDLAAPTAAKLTRALRDRLTLTPARIQLMANGLRDVAALPDPVGRTMDASRRPNGLQISRVRVPIGVIGIIYESRPNVTADAAGLCIKSGNAVILRGGSEAFHSNRAIIEIIQGCLESGGLPKHAAQRFSSTDRVAVDVLLQQDDSVDLIVPRGGKALIEKIMTTSRIPVVKHLDGVCHTYVDRAANVQMAEDVCFNAKCQKPSVCCAMESLLVHKSIAKKFLPRMAARYAKAGVKLYGCAETRKIVKSAGRATKATWGTEYLDSALSVKVVASLDEAMEHIATYGSAHTDAIITDDYATAERFLHEVDSAAVMVNASTYFHDGYEFGLGAEMGISTDRLHCRGPMGLEELTTYKWLVRGSGHIRT